MLTYVGKYATANVMIDEIDEATVSQIYQFINHYAFKDKTIIIMPDTHKGAGAVIGFTMEMGDSIIPNIVGVDVACGLMFVRLDKNAFDNFDRAKLDIEVRKRVPVGFNIHSKPYFNMERQFPWLKTNREMVIFTERFNDRYNTSYESPKVDYYWFKSNLCKRAGIDPWYACRSVGTLGGGK